MLRCLDLNLLSAPSRFGCDIWPCKHVASNPRFRSKSASRCVPAHASRHAQGTDTHRFTIRRKTWLPDSP
jgi:hypothetical protein